LFSPIFAPAKSAYRTSCT